MARGEKRLEADSGLRYKAEERYKAKKMQPEAFLSETERHKLTQELEIHQLELEMQNEELLVSKQNADIAAEKYRELYDFAPSGYFTISREGRIIALNICAAQMLGKERSYLLDTNLLLFVSDDSRQIYADFLERVFKSARKENCEIVLSTENTARKIIYLTGISAESDTQCFATAVDITNLRKAEEEREKLQQQLNHSHKMDSIGRLAGGIAHDFNNMLGVILGYTELAMSKIKPSEPISSDLEEIRKAGLRSAELTRQLLTYASRQIITPRVIDLNETIAKMLNMLRRLIGTSIKLEWKPEKRPCHVKVDSSQLDQILANLCVNARDAIKDVGHIMVKTERLVLDEEACRNISDISFDIAPGEYVVIAVSDDGCGMDKETMENLFEPFFTTKEFGKNVGLGLATVYGIVKQNHGCIAVDSIVGHGSVLRVYLPCHIGSAEKTSEEDKIILKQHGNETILLVEDEPSVLFLAKTILEEQGYSVLTAATPGEALAMAKKHKDRIQMLITDLIMPEMNGRELALELERRYPKIKCLYISGYSNEVLSEQGILNKNLHFIQKPFTLASFANKVRMILDKHI